MELYCSSASLLTSSLPTKPSSSPPYASCNSVFFSHGGRGLVSGRRISLVSRRRTTTGPTRRGLGCRCLFGLGVPELVVIAGVAALVFGPKKLPEVGRSIGKTVRSFQEAAKEFETELKKEPDESSKPPAAETPKAVSSEDEKKELETPATKENV